MNKLELSKKIISNDISRKKLITFYNNGFNKVLGIKIDDILEVLANYINSNLNDDKVLEGYILFLIGSFINILPEEMNLINDYSKKIISDTSNSKAKKLIVLYSAIMTEAKKNNLDVVFNIDYDNENILEMRPSIYKNNIKGIIAISDNVLNLSITELLFAGFHELKHLKDLVSLNNGKLDSKAKVEALMEFVIVFIEGNNEVYFENHDSFTIEKRADRFAFMKTKDFIEENYNRDKKIEALKCIREIYSNRENNFSEYYIKKIVRQAFLNIVRNKKTEIKELSLYLKPLKILKNK